MAVPFWSSADRLNVRETPGGSAASGVRTAAAPTTTGISAAGRPIDVVIAAPAAIRKLLVGVGN